MRTTLTIDDPIAEALKKAAYESGKSFKQVVNETLIAGLSANRCLPPTKPYKLEPASLGGPRPGVNLDKALWLADALEDEEIVRKLHMRK